MGWLRTIFNGDQTQLSLGESPSRTLSTWKERLTYFLYQTYAKLRIRELFNIIVEYPDSQPALQDLKECLGKTDLRSHLIQSLRVAMETRLLHPGKKSVFFTKIRGEVCKKEGKKESPLYMEIRKYGSVLQPCSCRDNKWPHPIPSKKSSHNSFFFLSSHVANLIQIALIKHVSGPPMLTHVSPPSKTFSRTSSFNDQPDKKKFGSIIYKFLFILLFFRCEYCWYFDSVCVFYKSTASFRFSRCCSRKSLWAS